MDLTREKAYTNVKMLNIANDKSKRNANIILTAKQFVGMIVTAYLTSNSPKERICKYLVKKISTAQIVLYCKL